MLNSLTIDSRYWCDGCDQPITGTWIQSGRGKYGRKFMNQGVATYHKECLERKKSVFVATRMGVPYERHYGEYKSKKCLYCNESFRPKGGFQKYCSLEHRLNDSNLSKLKRRKD